MKWESRIAELHPSTIHSPLSSVETLLFSMTGRSQNSRRKDKALRIPYHPLITLHRYSNHTPWPFHPGSAPTTFPNSPPWRFSSCKNLDSHHANSKGGNLPCFYFPFPVIRLSGSCISPLFWKMLLPSHIFPIHWPVSKHKLGMRSSFSCLSWSVKP